MTSAGFYNNNKEKIKPEEVETITDWKDVDFHSHMYKTNSLFNLPSLHHKPKGLQSTMSKFGMTGDKFFDA